MIHKGICAALLVGMISAGSAEPRGWLGVYNQELSQPMLIALNIDHGVLVSEVAENSPARFAGLKPGDVITQIDSNQICIPEDLSHYVSRRPEQNVMIYYLRQGKAEIASTKLGSREHQLEFPLEQWRGFSPAPMRIPPELRSSIEPYLDELRALKEEISELKKQIERFRKDLKKFEK